jgi:hypothetical protein
MDELLRRIAELERQVERLQRVEVPIDASGGTGILPPSAGGTGAGAMTQGSIPFIGPLGVYAQDNTALFWDDANNRLSIGQNVPIAPLDATLVDATTSGAARLFVLRHNTSGTPGTLFGDEIQWLLQSSTTADTLAARLRVTWLDATHATRTSRVQVFAGDSVNVTREIIRGEGDGTGPRIGFLGANASARPAVSGSRAANAALASLITALATLGLITDSSTV